MHAPRSCILHVINSLDHGGTQRSLVQLLRALPTSPHQHVVVTLRNAGDLAAQLPDHVACIALDARGSSRTTALHLAHIARKRNARVLHARNTGCWADAAIAGLLYPRMRVLLGFHGLDHPGRFPKRMQWIARCAAWSGARFTSVSRTGASLLESQAALRNARIALLPNGVDTRRFAPLEKTDRRLVRESLGLSSSTFVVGTVGSLTPVKRHVDLLDAFAGLQRKVNSHLIVIGDGPLRDMLTRHAAALQIVQRVHLLGPRDDVNRLLTALDVFVCPSESEAMCNALLEAMACRLPIVATNVGDNGQLVRHEQEGLLVSPCTPKALQEAILRLRDDPPLAARLATAAHRRAATFSLAAMTDRYVAYYDTLCSQNPPK